jgi:hypoxanthine phosphoribosyltransferase
LCRRRFVVKRNISEADLIPMFSSLFDQIGQANDVFTRVVGIERGGIPLAMVLSNGLQLPLNTVYLSFYDGEVKRPSPIIDLRGFVCNPGESVLIVDDLVDSGSTIQTFKAYLDQREVKSKTAVLYYKPHSLVRPDFYVEQTEDWIVFPWE